MSLFASVVLSIHTAALSALCAVASGSGTSDSGTNPGPARDSA